MNKSISLPHRVVMSVLIGSFFIGCVTHRGATLDSYRKAQKLVDQGVIELRQGNLSKAQASFEVAFELAPIASAIDGMGCVSFLEGEYVEAERYFIKAYQMDATYDYALGNLALLYDELGKEGLAERFYKAAINKNPDNYKFRNNFAVYLSKRQNSGKVASSELMRALALRKDKLIEHNLLEISQDEFTINNRSN